MDNMIRGQPGTLRHNTWSAITFDSVFQHLPAESLRDFCARLHSRTRVYFYQPWIQVAIYHEVCSIKFEAILSWD